MTYLLQNEHLIRQQRKEFDEISNRLDALSKLIIPPTSTSTVTSNQNDTKPTLISIRAQAITNHNRNELSDQRVPPSSREDSTEVLKTILPSSTSGTPNFNKSQAPVTPSYTHISPSDYVPPQYIPYSSSFVLSQYLHGDQMESSKAKTPPKSNDNNTPDSLAPCHTVPVRAQLSGTAASDWLFAVPPNSFPSNTATPTAISNDISNKSELMLRRSAVNKNTNNSSPDVSTIASHTNISSNTTGELRVTSTPLDDNITSFLRQPVPPIPFLQDAVTPARSPIALQTYSGIDTIPTQRIYSEPIKDTVRYEIPSIEVDEVSRSLHENFSKVKFEKDDINVRHESSNQSSEGIHDEKYLNTSNAQELDVKHALKSTKTRTPQSKTKMTTKKSPILGRVLSPNDVNVSTSNYDITHSERSDVASSREEETSPNNNPSHNIRFNVSAIRENTRMTTSNPDHRSGKPGETRVTGTENNIPTSNSTKGKKLLQAVIPVPQEAPIHPYHKVNFRI